MTEFESLVTTTLSELQGADYLGYSEASSCHQIKVSPESAHQCLDTLYRDKNFWCDHLISVSGEHVVNESNTVRIHYHIESITQGHRFHVHTEKQLLDPEEIPSFETVSDIWKSANWHERETAELFGVEFTGHPDPRKLLLPADWKGFPLRKGYVPQEVYHGVKVKY